MVTTTIYTISSDDTGDEVRSVCAGDEVYVEMSTSTVMLPVTGSSVSTNSVQSSVGRIAWRGNPDFACKFTRADAILGTTSWLQKSNCHFVADVWDNVCDARLVKAFELSVNLLSTMVGMFFFLAPPIQPSVDASH